MIGELYINGKDAQVQFGVSMDDMGLTTLMTPAALKEFVENKSRAIHGKQVLVSNPRVDERDVQLTVYLTASNTADFLSKYAAFVAELQAGTIHITTKYQPSVKYRMVYKSCTQFAQFNGRLGKFSLKLSEPNPNNRAV